MKKLFFALWPSNKVRKKMEMVNQSIKENGIKKVKPDNLHVTLVFLGNVDAESEVMIRESVEHINVQPFVLYFDQLDYWRKPRILCLSTQQYDPQLLVLVNALKSRVEPCGVKTEERPYKPHITLARKAHKLININVLPIEWQAHAFCLVQSSSTTNGIHYQVLQRWNFN